MLFIFVSFLCILQGNLWSLFQKLKMLFGDAEIERKMGGRKKGKNVFELFLFFVFVFEESVFNEKRGISSSVLSDLEIEKKRKIFLCSRCGKIELKICAVFFIRGISRNYRWDFCNYFCWILVNIEKEKSCEKGKTKIFYFFCDEFFSFLFPSLFFDDDKNIKNLFPVFLGKERVFILLVFPKSFFVVVFGRIGYKKMWYITFLLINTNVDVI